MKVGESAWNSLEIIQLTDWPGFSKHYKLFIQNKNIYFKSKTSKVVKFNVFFHWTQEIYLPFWTPVTIKRSFSCMCPHMFVQTRWLGEGTAALAANIWPFPGVYSDMLCQVGTLTKHPWAEVTFIGTITCVGSTVYFQRTRIGKWFTASRTY